MPTANLYLVTAENLNLHATAGLPDADVFETLPRGTEVTSTSARGAGAVPVQANLLGRMVTGFVSGTYLTPVTKAPPTLPADQMEEVLADDVLGAIMTDLGPKSRANCLPFLQKALLEFSITNAPRKASFLAQLAHESGQFRYFEEIASGAAYEGRKELGNTNPGDGVRYKGRGPIQLTGRNNYAHFGELLGIDLVNHPELAATLQVGFRTAAAYWMGNGLNELADRPGNFKRITKLINGGYNGLEDRTKYFTRAKTALGVPMSFATEEEIDVPDGDPRLVPLLPRGAAWERPFVEARG